MARTRSDPSGGITSKTHKVKVVWCDGKGCSVVEGVGIEVTKDWWNWMTHHDSYQLKSLIIQQML